MKRKDVGVLLLALVTAGTAWSNGSTFAVYRNDIAIEHFSTSLKKPLRLKDLSPKEKIGFVYNLCGRSFDTIARNVSLWTEDGTMWKSYKDSLDNGTPLYLPATDLLQCWQESNSKTIRVSFIDNYKEFTLKEDTLLLLSQ